MKQITNECPYCQNIMHVQRMRCQKCNVEIESRFPTSRLANLPSEHQRFMEMFLLAAGNLKEIAKLTGVSYPTLRSRLNKVIESLRQEISKDVATSGTPLDAVIPFERQLAPDSEKQREAGEVAGRLIKSI